MVTKSSMATVTSEQSNASKISFSPRKEPLMQQHKPKGTAAEAEVSYNCWAALPKNDRRQTARRGSLVPLFALPPLSRPPCVLPVLTCRVRSVGGQELVRIPLPSPTTLCKHVTSVVFPCGRSMVTHQPHAALVRLTL